MSVIDGATVITFDNLILLGFTYNYFESFHYDHPFGYSISVFDANIVRFRNIDYPCKTFADFHGLVTKTKDLPFLEYTQTGRGMTVTIKEHHDDQTVEMLMSSKMHFYFETRDGKRYGPTKGKIIKK